MITQDNFNQEYADPIEEQQIRHFVCIEMGRQIHRYIKAMHGSKQQMLRFEEHLKDLPLCEKEAAIARYIDLNRKAIKGLDMKIVLARAMANYSDTFDYLVTLVNDKRKMVRYLNLIREIYIQYHEVIERKGKFGILDHRGRTLVEPKYDFLRTCYVYVDDLRTMPVIAQLDGKLGLILPDGKNTVVAPFDYDSISLRDDPPYFEARIGKRKVLLTTDGREQGDCHANKRAVSVFHRYSPTYIEACSDFLQQSRQSLELTLPHTDFAVDLLNIQILVQFRRITFLLQQTDVLIYQCHLRLHCLLLRIATLVNFALILF